MKSPKRTSERPEYAFSIMYNLLGVITHQMLLVTSVNISDGLVELSLPDNPTNRYIVAKRMAESSVKYDAYKQKLECKIISSIGSLIPISPSILNPIWN